MKTISTFLGLFIFMSFTFLACETEDIEDTGDNYEMAAMELELHDLINDYRKSINKSELTWDKTIAKKSREHSINMANGTTDFGHDGFSERVDEIRAEIGGGAAAENVAYNYTDAEGALNQWLNSSGHKKNIEGDYTHAGIGIAKNGNEIYYTQIFLKK